MSEQQAEYGKRRKVAKSNRPLAEKAAEHYLYEVCGCDPAQIRRAVRTQWQAVDFFGCDVMGRRKDGLVFFAQVTAGQNEAVRVRRRKLEKISWNHLERIMVLQLVEQFDPANARKKIFYFRVHRLVNHVTMAWEVDEQAVQVPKTWFVKLRADEND